MLTRQVKVIASTADQVSVKGINSSDCRLCQRQKGCLQSWFGVYKHETLSIKTQQRYQTGDTLHVTLKKGVLVRSAFFLYGLPVFMLLFFALIGAGLSGEKASIFLGFIGFLVGGCLANRALRRDCMTEPVQLKERI